MTYKIIIDSPAHTAQDGTPVEAWKKEFECPYELSETVWVVKRKRRKHVVVKDRVCGVWATNTFGITLYNEGFVHESNFDIVFRSKEEAIDYCIKQNQRVKIKVYEY